MVDGSGLDAERVGVSDVGALLAPFRRDALWLALLGIVLFASLNLFKDTLVDDAFITFRYARTLRESGTWGMFPGHVANVVTSPLNVILLALIASLTSSVVNAALVLTLVELILLAVLLRGLALAVELPVFGCLGFIVLICNPLLLSTIGLESILLTTSLVAAIYAYVTKRWNLVAAACAIATLARPDGALLGFIAVSVLPTFRLRARTLALYVLFVLPWYLFSWVYLGSVLPDTFLLKYSHGWGDLTFANAIPFYFRRYPLEMTLSLGFLPFALLAAVMPLGHLRPVVWILSAFGLLHFGAYAWLHVPPHHWYYTPEVASIGLLGAVTVAALHKRMANAGRKHIAHILVGLAFVIPTAGVSYLVARSGVVLQEALMHSNWATPGQYRDVGLWLREHHAGDTIPLRGEVGTLAYYCDCNLIDMFGDRTWLTDEVRGRTGRSGLKAFIFRVNFLFYRGHAPYVPGAYRIESSASLTPITDTSAVVWETSSRWVKRGQIALLKAK